MTEWPFSIAELTAGLRRYFAEPALKVKSASEYPLSLRHQARQVRGLRVEYGVGLESVLLDCVVKEPKGASRAGLAGAGRREVGVYQALAAHLPMPTPALIAADPLGDWLVLEAVEADVAPDEWSADDYRRGVQTLAALHERFWNLAEDLSAYKWLARPLAGDFEIHVYAAAQAVEKMIVDDRPRLITGSMNVLGAVGQMIAEVEQVAESLRAAPQTLLHGDFGPRNVALQSDGEMVVMDWQLAGLGPGILDLVTFITTIRWERSELPVAADDLIALYRDEMEQRVGMRWSDEEWAAHWDHALIWRFIQEMFVWVASTPAEEFEARAAQFDEIWLKPVVEAVERRLRPVFYI